MDTSKEYILMCEKAIEIQNLKEIHYCGDFIFDQKIKVVNGYDLSEGGNCFRTFLNIDDNFIEEWYLDDVEKLKECHCIWLPRQDQLQEMIKIDYPKINKNSHEIADTAFNELHQRFHYFIHSFRMDDFINTKWVFDTYEKYWLAFVMQDNYGKEWSEEHQAWILDEPPLCKLCGTVAVSKEGDLCMVCGHS